MATSKPRKRRHSPLLLSAPGVGVAPLRLKLPTTGCEIHAALELPGTLIPDLASARIVPGTRIGIGNRFGEFVRENIGDAIRTLAVAVATQHRVIAARNAGRVRYIGHLDACTIAAPVRVPGAIVNPFGEIRCQNDVDGRRISVQSVSVNYFAGFIHNSGCAWSAARRGGRARRGAQP